MQLSYRGAGQQSCPTLQLKFRGYTTSILYNRVYNVSVLCTSELLYMCNNFCAYITTGPTVLDGIQTIGTTVEVLEQFFSPIEVRGAKESAEQSRDSNPARLV